MSSVQEPISESIGLSEASQPVNINETSEPVDVLEVSPPIDTSEAKQPVDFLEASQPVDTSEATQPVDTSEATEPTDINATSGPVDLVEASDPGDIDEASEEVSLSEASNEVKDHQDTQETSREETADELSAYLTAFCPSDVPDNAPRVELNLECGMCCKSIALPRWVAPTNLRDEAWNGPVAGRWKRTKEPLCVTICGHIFGMHCFQEYRRKRAELGKQLECPMCRLVLIHPGCKHQVVSRVVPAGLGPELDQVRTIVPNTRVRRVIGVTVDSSGALEAVFEDVENTEDFEGHATVPPLC
ncbi:hypothetical protein F5Y18DRAFT_436600 [Xylariaceae sp. FL1019]|nr:hypothetical protein F5Y18DRAFT_436600 [Xylariaceae sp. FL1019]